MSSSYENRWLSTGEDPKKNIPVMRRKSTTTEETPVAKETKKKENNKPDGQPAKKSQKDMTKAERRALQEQQRAAKEKQRPAANQPKGGKQSAENDTKKASSVANNANNAKASEAKQKKSKSQQNQVPWLLHLDTPKRPEASKDLHPAVIQLGLYFSEHKIVGSNARCVAMLDIFSKVNNGSKRCCINFFFYIGHC